MDHPTDQNQYAQYYNSFQQQATTEPYHQSSSVQAYYDYTNQQYYNSYQQQPANDPSQVQSYDQASSVQAYYPYQYQYQPEPAVGQPSGSTVDPIQYASGQESAYYPQPYGSVDNHTQFAGHVGTSQWGVKPQTGQSSFRGKAKRGVKPFQGGGRGYLATRGKGHGKNRGRSIPPNLATSAQPNSVSSVSQTIPVKRPLRVAWCELCRIDCNTPEILEQHKNGKKHKKNLQAQKQPKNQTKTGIKQGYLQLPNSEIKAEVVQLEEAVKTQMDSAVVTAVAFDDGKKNEAQNLKNPEQNKPEGFLAVNSVEEPKGKSKEGFQGHGRGLKRKMRGGRMGKFIRTSEGSRRLVEPPKPKEVIPYICELCNVKCETQLVFNSHLAGKKHLSNVKRFHGDRALYGEGGLQALYPSNLAASSSSAIPQAQQGAAIDPQVVLTQQGLADPQVLLAHLINYFLLQAQAQAPGILNTQIPEQVVLPAQARNPQISQMHESQAVAESGGNTGKMVPAEGGQRCVKPEFETACHENTDPKNGDESLVAEEKDEAKAVAAGKKEELVSQQAVSAAKSDQTEPSCPMSS